MASLPRMAEVWLRDPRRLRAEPRFAQQKAALRAQSIVGLLPQMARLAARSQKIACGSEVCAAKPRIRGLRSKSSDPRFRDPRIIAQKLGSEVCAAKS